MNKGTSTGEYICYAIIMLSNALHIRMIPDYSSSFRFWSNLIIAWLGFALTLFFLWYLTKQRNSYEQHLDTHLIFEYCTSINSREAMFARDFQQFVADHDIQDPEYFVMQCVQSAMKSYEDPPSDSDR